MDVMREAEIRALHLLGQEMPDVLQHLVRAAAAVTGAAVAELNLITSTTQHTLVTTGEAPGTCDARDSFCAKIVREPTRLHVVPDSRADERFRDSPFSRSGTVVSYAASQLVTRSGTTIGTLCVYDPQHKVIDEAMMSTLAELAEATVEVLESRRRHLDMKDALAELADGSRELRRSNEHLAAFAGQVSHDLQGPLSAVTMALQMLVEEHQDDPEPAPQTDVMLVTRALSGAQRMRRTIAGLMDFAAIGGTLEAVPLDTATLVADAVADLAPRLGRCEIVVGSLPKIWGDEVQLRAVIQNLLANAVKYAGQVDAPVIRVEGSLSAERTRITVSDNGPGVPVDQRESIFELMVRGDGANESGVDGLGIGLTTCRRIIDAHRGTLAVGESADGGAAFWFELPRRERALGA
ncbi:MAG: ATP-binding protein [Marmoricola sp.]